MSNLTKEARADLRSALDQVKQPQPVAGYPPHLEEVVSKIVRAGEKLADAIDENNQRKP